jgi:solute carrier family 50 protein (sugar transporter)
MVIFPIIGVILSNLFGLNIAYSYYINRTTLLQEYNEILFTIIFFNALNWSLYGIISKNIFLYTCNICSIISSFGFNNILYKYIDIKKVKYIEMISLIGILYLLTMTFIINFIVNDNNKLIINICGSVAMSSSMITYFSPILIIKRVIDTKDPSLIYLPQAIIGTINLSSWLIYAFMINDIYQILTDIFGIAMCLIQIIIYTFYTLDSPYSTNKFFALNL